MCFRKQGEGPLEKGTKMETQEEQLVEALKAEIANEKEAVKAILKDAYEQDKHHGNPFILLSIAKDLYAHSKRIMDLKMLAPKWAEL